MAEFDKLRLDRGIIEGDVTRVRSVLLNGASPDGDKNAGKKPIHFAVENDSIQIVELLCECGAKVNVPNPEEQGGTPLHMAVKRGFTSVAKCLLEKSADPNVKDGEGDTPLITAIRKGEISSAGLLLKYGADLKKRDLINDSALHIAVKKNNGEIVQMLLKEGASVNNINMQGDFTIHVAARNASEWILETLKDFGCDMNQRHRDGSSPLHLAAESGNLEAVKWLLRNGAKLDDLDAADKTPMDRAADAKKTHVVDWIKDSKLVDRKIRTPNKRDEIRQNAEKGKQSHLKSNITLGVPNEEEDAKGTRKPQAHAASRFAAEDAQHPSWLRQGTQGVPDDQLPKVHGGTSGGVVPTKSTTTIATNVESEILRASREGNVEKVKRLIQRNTDLEVTDKKGQRPLHLAALGGHDAVVKELLSGGADVAAKGPEGLSTIHYAAKGGHVSTLFTLLESQCDIEALTEDGSTALHLAALNGHSTTVEWLVKQARLKVTLANKKRETALDLARKAGKEDMIQFLVKECTKEALKSGDVVGLRDLARKGVDVDAVGFRKGLRPAHTAAMHGHINLLKNLREIRCDVKAETDKGLTALHIAAHYNHLKAVRWLVEEAGLEVSHRSKDGHTALDYAESRGHEDITTYLKQVIQSKDARKVGSGEAEGNRITEKGPASGGRGGGGAEAAGGGGPTMTLRSAKTSKLIEKQAREAAQAGDVDKMKAIVQRGFDVDTEFLENATKGWRLLHFAAERGHTALVIFLIENKAAVNASSREGMTPLHLASWGGHTEVIKALLSKGASGNAKTTAGMTAIHLASMGGHVASLEELASSCSLGSSNRDGKSALHLAAEYGNLDAVRWLVLRGLDVSLRDHSGWTCLQYAKDEGHKKVVEFLGKRLKEQPPQQLTQAQIQNELKEMRQILQTQNAEISRLRNAMQGKGEERE